MTTTTGQFVGSIAAIITPMTSTGELDLPALGRLMEAHRRSGTEGLVIAGTTGESAALGDAEYQTLIEYAVEHADGLKIIAGAGAAATDKALSLAKRAQAAGAQALLCVTPYYLKTTQAGLAAHYRSLLDAVDTPIILYNVPGRTGVDLLPETVGELSQLPGVVGLKEAVAGPERVQQLKACCDPSLTILSGDDGSALAAMRAGAKGVISVTANIAPAAMSTLCRLALDGQWAEAEQLDARLADLHQLLMAEPNPIPAKTLLNRMGWIAGGIRLPLVMATDDLINSLQSLVSGAIADLVLTSGDNGVEAIGNM